MMESKDISREFVINLIKKYRKNKKLQDLIKDIEEYHINLFLIEDVDKELYQKIRKKLIIKEKKEERYGL